MRILIVGTGSIGRRHIATLKLLEPDANYVFVRRGAAPDDLSRSLGATVVASLADGLGTRPDLAVIANPSSLHCETILPLLASRVPAYIEKPVAVTRSQAQSLEGALSNIAEPPATIVGCVLRFLPSLQAARRLISDGSIGRPVRASLQVGQWLPSWRPGTDYKSSYSANPELGGGVVLDLIHELDAARWLFGEFDTMAAVGGSYSSLGIQAEDAAVVTLGRSAGPVVAVSLDYVARTPIRRYEVVGDEATLTWDLFARSLTINAPTGMRQIALPTTAFDMSATYVSAMRELLLAGSADGATNGATSQDLKEGLKSAWLAIRANEMIRGGQAINQP